MKSSVFKLCIKYVFVLACLLFIAGCSSAPSIDVVQGALLQAHGYDKPIKFDVFKITNKYQKQSGNETVYVYEIEFTSNEVNMTGTWDERISLVKRGDKWYRVNVR